MEIGELTTKIDKVIQDCFMNLCMRLTAPIWEGQELIRTHENKKRRRFINTTEEDL